MRIRDGVVLFIAAALAVLFVFSLSVKRDFEQRAGRAETEARRAAHAHQCTTFLNFRAIERSILAGLAAQGIQQAPNPRLVVTEETRAACADAGIEIK